LNEERRFRLYSRAIDGFVVLARTGFIVVAAIVLGKFARDVLIAYAGKETAANLAFSLLVKLQADRWFAYWSVRAVWVMVSSSGDFGNEPSGGSPATPPR